MKILGIIGGKTKGYGQARHRVVGGYPATATRSRRAGLACRNPFRTVPLRATRHGELRLNCRDGSLRICRPEFPPHLAVGHSCARDGRAVRLIRGGGAPRR